MIQSTVHRRSFEAAKYPKDSPERNALNCDPLTSEYFPTQLWALRRPATMSDGTPNPVQKFYVNTFKTKAKTEEAKQIWDSHRS